MSSVCFRPSLVPSRSLTQAAPSNKRWQLKDKPQPHPTLAATYLPTRRSLLQHRHVKQRIEMATWMLCPRVALT
jgi:hypothetical protein